MTDTFIKYPSIENSYQEKFIDTIISIVPRDEAWCVLEKIHGANIQIYYDENGFKYGKRSSYINGSFYNAHNVLPKYEDILKKMYEEYKKPIRIFGEIFGGKYDGKFSNVKCVQKEIEYCQDINAMFFDLMIGDEGINYRKAIHIFDDYGIPCIKPLAVCQLELALKYSNNFPSTICEYYNLPKKEENICEGIVIKPFDHEYITHNGSRVILKNKNEKFNERSKLKEPKKVIEFSEVANKLIAELESYITENRFNAVFNKKEYSKKDFGMCLGDFVKDLREDAKKDEIVFDCVDVDETKRVNKIINMKAVMFIKKLFFSKIEF